MYLQDIRASAHTPDVLDCNVMRPFWVSWDNGLIQVTLLSYLVDSLLLHDNLCLKCVTKLHISMLRYYYN